MKNETKEADMRDEATDRAFKKEIEKLSLFGKIYYSFVILSLLCVVGVMGSLIAEYLFK